MFDDETIQACAACWGSKCGPSWTKCVYLDRKSQHIAMTCVFALIINISTFDCDSTIWVRLSRKSDKRFRNCSIRRTEKGHISSQNLHILLLVSNDNNIRICDRSNQALNIQIKHHDGSCCSCCKQAHEYSRSASKTMLSLINRRQVASSRMLDWFEPEIQTTNNAFFICISIHYSCCVPDFHSCRSRLFSRMTHEYYQICLIILV